MEFNQKLQELRKQKGLTQEELAAALFVSRAAISKWESGRGYPGIDSLKLVAKFFSVSLDELLSTDEMLTVAEEDGKQKEKHLLDLIYGLLDLSIALLLFLPFFADCVDGKIQSVSLLALSGVQPYLRAVYYAVVASLSAMGVVTLTLQNCQAAAWLKFKSFISIILGTAAVLIFIISQQPYSAVFAFVLLSIKAFMLLRQR